RQVLVDGGDPTVQCLARGVEPYRLPLHQVLTGVVLVRPGQDLDQRGLAGAVVAEHAGDLTGVDHGGHPVERDDAAVALADLPDLQQRSGHGRHLRTRSARRRKVLLMSTAPSSITPRNNMNQSLSQRAKTMP